jgi:hypothetical protein
LHAREGFSQRLAARSALIEKKIGLEMKSITAIFIGILLAAVARADSLSISLESTAAYDDQVNNHTQLFVVGANKSLQFQAPNIVIGDWDNNLLAAKNVGWTDGDRHFVLTLNQNGYVSFGVENQQGGMDTVSSFVSGRTCDVNDIWIGIFSEASELATLKIDSVNGVPIANTPQAWSRLSDGQSALEVTGFQFQAGTAVFAGNFRDSSNVNSNRTVNLLANAYIIVPETGTVLLLAAGLLPVVGLRRARCCRRQ